jgi:glutaredoxin
MQRFVLYSTSGCHLCEEAGRLIRSIQGFAVTEVDIATDEALLALYATRIPVLRAVDSGAEIGWPFSAQQVQAWIHRA